MKKRVLSLILAAALALALVPTAALAAVTVTEVIPCKYEGAESFSEGLAAVRLNGKWGFIDKEGKVVVPCKYDGAGSFSEGLAAVMLNDKWGFIDKTGKEVAACQYYDVSEFSEGLAAVVNDARKLGFINTTGAVAIPFSFYYTMSAWSFRNGVAPVAIGGTAGDYGDGGPALNAYINATGAVVAKLGESAYDTLEQQYWTWDGVDSGNYDTYYKDGKWGFVSRAGGEVVPCKYDEAYSFSEGLAAVDLSGKWGFLSITGSVSDTAYANTQTVTVDGKKVTFQCYALKDENGDPTNYVKLRDLAMYLSGTAAQFQVDWDGAAKSIALTSGKAYTPDGSENSTPYSGNQVYAANAAKLIINGEVAILDAFTLDHGGFTYFQLRELGQALGFNVGWSRATGIFVETDKPYDPRN